MSATQQLSQQVLQKYGWGCKIEKNNNNPSDDDNNINVWSCTVTTGIGKRHHFVSDCIISSDDDDTKNKKEGTNAASAVALQGLAPLIAAQHAKPVFDLKQVFPGEIPIYESNPENWDYFWSTHTNKKKRCVVGIDTEGNQTTPPVLIQIATDDYTILEVPVADAAFGGRRRISANLERLLRDETIIKVFCDNYSHRDKTALGLSVDKDNDEQFCGGSHIVDIETMASQDHLLGPVKVARGLGRIASLCLPQAAGVLIRKPKQSNAINNKGGAGKGRSKIKGRFQNIGRFAMIEQGKAPPLRSMYDLSHREQQYAALDAWVTLQCYKQLAAATTAATTVPTTS